jgi:hypothetical protein
VSDQATRRFYSENFEYMMDAARPSRTRVTTVRGGRIRIDGDGCPS